MVEGGGGVGNPLLGLVVVVVLVDRGACQYSGRAISHGAFCASHIVRINIGRFSTCGCFEAGAQNCILSCIVRSVATPQPRVGGRPQARAHAQDVKVLPPGFRLMFSRANFFFLATFLIEMGENGMRPRRRDIQ